MATSGKYSSLSPRRDELITFEMYTLRETYIQHVG